MSMPKAPKMPKPRAQAPTPMNLEPPRRELGDEERNQEQRKKRGRNSLRIDPNSAGGASSKGGAGINVPMK